MDSYGIPGLVDPPAVDRDTGSFLDPEGSGVVVGIFPVGCLRHLAPDRAAGEGQAVTGAVYDEGKSIDDRRTLGIGGIRVGVLVGAVGDDP